MKKFTLGTTSFIFPDTIYENCKRLEKLVDQVSIVMFETKACINYSEQDLPKDLSKLDLEFNIHLPLDLPWELGAREVFYILDTLLKKTEFLNPNSYTLHPPEKREDFYQLIDVFNEKDIPLNKFFIENIRENDLSNIWDILLENRIKICLDIGHLFEYNQKRLLTCEDLIENIGMLHLYTSKNGKHISLANLSKDATNFLITILKSLKQKDANTHIIIEVFDYNDLISSLDFFNSLSRNI